MGDWNNTFPDLPILEELGAQLQHAADQDDQSRFTEPAHSSRTRGPTLGARLRRRPALRPVLVALAVIALAVPVALLARSALSPPAGPSPSETQGAVTVARGSGPQDAWALRRTQTHNTSCLRLDVSGAQPGPASCIDDAASQVPLDFSVTNGPRDGFVVGTTTSGISKVRVSIGSREVTADVRQPAEPLAPQGVNVFVAAFEQKINPTTPIDVAALDAQGNVITSLSKPPGR